MGNELIVVTLPSENLAFTALRVNDKEGRSVSLHELYDRDEAYKLMRDRRELLRRHPDAHYSIQVGLDTVWQPPPEPHRKKGATRISRHRKAMAKSLLDYLNERLAGLDEMLRTGSFVIERARVLRVSVKPVPEYAWEKFARSMKRDRFSSTKAPPSNPKDKES